ncbi:MAG TPA: DUF2782 domain-containing protein [Betaproteobacteria bacterium]|jgi:hypothetical protein|nr:DUF2782 domain-containing protein [Betaproteobacteria bacterium]
MTKGNDMKSVPVLLALFCATLANAADAPRRPANVEIIDEVALPKGKTRLDFDKDLNVTTRTSEDETITEYRLKGKLYKMVVKPNNGTPAYILIDDKGEGKFVRAGEAGTKIAVPMWVLLTW